MNSDWPSVSLPSVIADIVDNRGRAAPTSSIGFPLIATNCIKEDSLYPTFENVRYVSHQTYETWFRSHPKPGDVILVNKGTPGRVCQVPDPVAFCIAQDMMALRPNRDVVDPDYLLAALRSQDFKNQVEGLHVGTLIPHLKKQDLPNLRIPLPPLPIQKTIGAIYCDLSRKIEFNRRMNRTLEAMAQALFKSWFVDFDPVAAKAEGRQPFGMSAETAALFPAGFEDSKLGRVPKGWKIGQIGDIAKVVDCLHSKKPLRRELGRPLLQLNNIRDDGLLDMSDTYWISEQDYATWTTRMEASPGDCVITNVGRVGAVAQIPPGRHAALGRNMTGIRCAPDFPFPTYLVLSLLSDAMRDEIDLKTDAGTILNALNVKNIPLLKVVIPSEPVLNQLERVARPLRAHLECNLAESQTLMAVRDALLPKLLSGEIGVKAAESILEDPQAAVTELSDGEKIRGHQR